MHVFYLEHNLLLATVLARFTVVQPCKTKNHLAWPLCAASARAMTCRQSGKNLTRKEISWQKLHIQSIIVNMKKIFKYVLVSSLFFCLFSGCRQKIDSASFIKNNSGKKESVVMLAVQTKNIQLLREVLQAGLDCNEGVFGNITPLMWACREGNLKQVKLLVEAGADTTAFSGEDLAPLEYACLSGNPEVVKYIAEKGGNVNHVNHGDMTPLITSASNNNYKVVQALIEAGAEVDWQDSNGDTALMYAVYNHAYKTAKVLVQNGAAPGIVNKNGQSPYSFADSTMKKYLSR